MSFFDESISRLLEAAWDAGYHVGYEDCLDGGNGLTNPFRAPDSKGDDHV